jgi:hypothetical protein
MGPREAGKRGRSLKALCPASLNLMQVQLGRTSADDGFLKTKAVHTCSHKIQGCNVCGRSFEPNVTVVVPNQLLSSDWK